MRSATRAALFDERTDAKVAMASTRVPAAIPVRQRSPSPWNKPKTAAGPFLRLAANPDHKFVTTYIPDPQNWGRNLGRWSFMIGVKSALTNRSAAGAESRTPQETVLPIYRAAHRQPAAIPTLRLRQPRNTHKQQRSHPVAEELSRPGPWPRRSNWTSCGSSTTRSSTWPAPCRRARGADPLAASRTSACSRRPTSCPSIESDRCSAACSAPGCFGSRAPQPCSAASSCTSASTSRPPSRRADSPTT